MKKILYLCVAAFMLAACNESKTVSITVFNPLSLDRNNEIVEVSIADVSTKLQLADDAQFVIYNTNGQEVAYQITSDDKLIFPADVPADSTAVYVVKKGKPATVPTLACGRQYPERVDDLAWENDLVAFRAYGPALQKTGERAFGYDVWTKYNTSEPVVEDRYAMELNPETLAAIDSLKIADPNAAKELRAATSYHLDHGNGLDCYKVGPTLGGGTAALMSEGNIIYPYCYNDYKILDNGPLRFSVQLVYNPLTVKENTDVVETRIITLDAGSHLNKTVISYSGLNETTEIAAGLVLHEADGEAVIAADATQGYITYADPTDNASGVNGKIFVAAVVPGAVKEAKAIYFSKEEKEKERGGADGHVLAISDYQPGTNYTYYWGSAWSKAGMDAESWNQYVAEYAQKVRKPLEVTVL
ncbi:DUF4861 domain-containing protein [Bacteroides sp. 224]|uniref:DUF4861 domain-containing protein n=1 Tax=Bacteroides sp. 224 TaxID=2302936 RepID=UPI0013D3DB5A|nr:DUF4861 domain-containing protein [Bacteroides sp. 224]NDV65701.1 DUF4861 domain-containing protein [Bacteroides sp. 224]